LGEHQLDKLGVTGSSPVPPIMRRPCKRRAFVVFAGTEIAFDAASKTHAARCQNGDSASSDEASRPRQFASLVRYPKAVNVRL
jgi:hypothetical protein